MSDADHKTRMAALEQRLAAAQKAQAPKPPKDDHHAQAQLAWRMVVELVAGLGIGFGIGYGLDLVAGTLPFGLVIFTLLGLAAGVKTMMRSAAEVQKDRAGAPAAGDGHEGDRDGDGN